jgi:hypothetical protein
MKIAPIDFRAHFKLQAVDDSYPAAEERWILTLPLQDASIVLDTHYMQFYCPAHLLREYDRDRMGREE